MAHTYPGGGDEDRTAPEDDPHRAAGWELETFEDPEQAAAEEQEWHVHLPLFFRVIDSVVKTVMVVFLVVLLVAVGANVFGRFVLNTSLPASAELARFLFIWVIFLGAALAHLHNEHIAVTVFVDRLTPAARRWVVVLQEVIILVVVVALLLSAVQVMSIDPGTSALLNVPLQWVNFSVPFSAGLMGLITLYRIAVALRSSPEQKAA
ncbi:MULTISPECIES: TRAP transporter small permease [unclassified Ornithinimicrobium]|uniref:TRAP transporter small permease n=1 Tax=unclassified Ornithinimicrobium TaxID=2615080 RepID=UPI003852C42D